MQDLAEMLALAPTEVVKFLFMKGVMVQMNSTLDPETVKAVGVVSAGYGMGWLAGLAGRKGQAVSVEGAGGQCGITGGRGGQLWQPPVGCAVQGVQLLLAGRLVVRKLCNAGPAALCWVPRVLMCCPPPLRSCSLRGCDSCAAWLCFLPCRATVWMCWTRGRSRWRMGRASRVSVQTDNRQLAGWTAG